MFKRCLLIGGIILTFAACTHVPRTCVLQNPQTGHEVILSKQSPSPLAGWYGVGVAIVQRQNQKELIEAYKSRGYIIVHESKQGL